MWSQFNFYLHWAILTAT